VPKSPDKGTDSAAGIHVFTGIFIWCQELSSWKYDYQASQQDGKVF